MEASQSPYGLPFEPNLDAPDGAPSTRSVTTVLRERWLTVAIVFLLVSVPAVTGVWLLSVPLYAARRQINIEPNRTSDVFPGMTQGMIASKYDAFRSTQAAQIGSSRVLDDVLDRAQRRKNADGSPAPVKWLAPEGAALTGVAGVLERFRATTPYERLLETLHVSMPPGNQLITVAIEAPNKRDAVFLANAIVDAYIDKIPGSQMESARKRLADVRTLASEHRAEMRVLRQKRDSLIDELPPQYQLGDLAALRSKLTEISRTFQGHKDDLVQAKLERVSVRVQLDVTRAAIAGAVGESNGTVEARDRTPKLDLQGRVLKRQLDDLSAKRDALVTVGGAAENHPDVRRLDKRIKRAQSDLDAHEKELAANPFGMADPLGSRGRPTIPAMAGVAGLKVKLADWDVRIAALEETIEWYKADAAQLRTAVRKVASIDETLADLTVDEQLARKHYEYRELGARWAAEAPQVSAGPRAFAKSRPTKDRRIALSLMSVFGALCAGLGLAYLRDMRDTSVRAPEDAQLTGGALFLGALPYVRQMPALLPSPETSDVPRPFAEEIRIIRTSLLSRLDTQASTSLLVTSCDAGSGKTTLSAHLAMSLGAMGKRVLLVDADLARPTLEERCGVQASAGLAELLGSDGWLTPMDVVVRTALPMVDVVTAGAAEQGSDLMGRGNIGEYMTVWKENYDVIIVDGPPILGLADGQILASVTDHTVLAIRASQTPREAVAEASEKIRNINGSLIGVVLNSVDKGAARYGYYGSYSNYHSYGKDRA